jgi:hypothetical protein
MEDKDTRRAFWWMVMPVLILMLARLPALGQTNTPTRVGTSTPKGTPTPTRTQTPTWGVNTTPTWTPRYGGAYLCRGGTAQGEPCGGNTDCPGISQPPSTPAPCRFQGHQALCANAPVCIVSSSLCTDNLDCPLWPQPTPTDYCNAGEGLYVPQFSCSTDADCGQCVGGTTPGWACRPLKNDCSGGGSCNTALGTCILGVQQGQNYVYPQGSGVAGDVYADYGLLNQTLESNQNGPVNNTTARSGVAVRYFRDLDTLVHIMNGGNTVRVQGWESASTLANNAAISWYLSAIDQNHGLWEMIPGDNTIVGHMSQNALNQSGGLPSGIAFDPVTDSFWISDVDSIREYSSRPHSKDLPNRILGHSDYTGYSRVGYVCHAGTNDGTACNPNLDCPGGACVPAGGLYTCVGGSNTGTPCNVNASCTGGGTCNGGLVVSAAGIDALQRCNGATTFGTPCHGNGECADGTCTTMLAVADWPYNKVLIWKDISTAQSGAAPEYFLGQIDGVQNSPNQGHGAPTASSLYLPFDVRFDPNTGEIYVLDMGNGRVVRYPKTAQTGANADLVFGASNLTSFGSNLFTYAPGAWGPHQLSIDPVTGRLAVADTFGHRVLVFTPPFRSPVTTADMCLGQPDCTTKSAGLASSDGTKLDRLWLPQGMSSDGNGGLYVGDFGNNRDLHFPAPLSTNEAADLRLGTTTASSHGQLSAHTESGSDWGGICFFRANGKTGVCKVSTEHNRALCWLDWSVFAVRGLAPETDADAILGQADGMTGDANAGGRSAASLSSPYGCAADDTYLYIADAGNNRVTRYTLGSPTALTTHQSASACIGQANCTSATAATTATGLNYPTGVAISADGNLWIVDQRNRRVVLRCEVAGTDQVCTAANSGDDTWDLALGQPDMTHNSSVCTDPADASRFCLPWSTIPYGGSSIFVADVSNQTNGARIQIFDQPWSTGMAASSTLGQIDTNRLAAYGGVCVGGPSAGQACSDPNDWYRQGTASTACPLGYCSYAIRPLANTGNPITMALDTRHSPARLWVSRPPGMLRWSAPFSTGREADLETAANTNHQFYFTGTGYVPSQPCHHGGGIAAAPDGSIWYSQGGGENIGAIWAMMDPDIVPTATPSSPKTPATITPTSTGTSTGIQTPTATPTVTSEGPTLTPTHTDTPMLTATSTATAPPATATMAVTATPLPCVGDCNGDRQITVDEILSMVNTALGRTSVSACDRGDLNRNGEITVDEILTAVSNALNGCPS